MSAPEALARLVACDHGTLCTVHPRRGVDAVPVVYVADDGYVGMPIDTVKAKSSTHLQRQRNLQVDPRAALLVEHWDRDDWSRLWWVRAQLQFDGDVESARTKVLSTMLAATYPQYRAEPFADVLALRIVGLSGWTAEQSRPSG